MREGDRGQGERGCGDREGGAGAAKAELVISVRHSPIPRPLSGEAKPTYQRSAGEESPAAAGSASVV